jgi:chemotaxis protein methyltransferase CheR
LLEKMNQYFELGIVETRNIIKEIKEKYCSDFKDFALTSFKRRLEHVIHNYSLKGAEGLINKLNENKDFFDVFLKEISVESTEMFRDPSTWRHIQEDITLRLIKSVPKPKIWFPNCVSGDELFSLVVLLHEKKLLDKFEIIAGYISDSILENIQSGKLNTKKIVLSEDNFKRINSAKKFSDYYQMKNNVPVKDISLIKNVKFIKQNIIFDDIPENVDCVIYRNQMIYFNQTLQDKALKIIEQSLKIGGLLIIGTNEKVPNYFRGIANINPSESVYKKKNF